MENLVEIMRCVNCHVSNQLRSRNEVMCISVLSMKIRLETASVCEYELETVFLHMKVYMFFVSCVKCYYDMMSLCCQCVYVICYDRYWWIGI